MTEIDKIGDLNIVKRFITITSKLTNNYLAYNQYRSYILAAIL